MAFRQASTYPSGALIADRYEAIEQIGHGTTGNVYLCQDLDGDLLTGRVALKVIHKELYSDRQIFGRFHREAKILKRLDGPHVAKLIDFIEHDGQLIIVLEYVDGPSLEQYLQRCAPLGIAESVTIITQICAALQAAHDAGVIHRDLKPANVLVEGISRDFSFRQPERDVEAPDSAPRMSFLTGLAVRVVDFGLAKVALGDAIGTALTEQDMIFGTPDYMSPEQVRGDELDARCDIYAAGVMLYEMLVGKAPFCADSPFTTMTAHLSEPVPPPSERAPDGAVSAPFERCILKALAKDRDERYASATELGQAVARSSIMPDEAEAENNAELSYNDTQIDGNTLHSHEDESLVEGESKRAKVQVIVREAAPVSEDSALSRSGDEGGVSETDSEQHFWTVAAVLAALIAVGVGIFIGVR